ncbi:MAG: ATP-binding protein [bacterium]
MLTGGRQVGKTTLLKQIIQNLLTKQRVSPDQIWYLPCDTIERFDQLLFYIEEFQNELANRRPFFLFIDEITYVREWDRAIKSLADAGLFRNGSVLITGSDTVVLKDAMKRFPGRRGAAAQQDFHYNPLSFSQYVTLVDPALAAHFDEAKASFQSDFKFDPASLNTPALKKLEDRFFSYLLAGGFLRAINDFAKGGVIPQATYQTYIQWIIGDVLKRGKQEKYLRELIEAVIPRLTKQLSWHKITSVVSIDHHQTVADYLGLLERMDVLNVVYALREDKLKASPKKEKKIHFNDPFIFHALHGWIHGGKDLFPLARRTIEEGGDMMTAIIEGTIASLMRRQWESYYIKAEGEVDIVVVSGGTFFPIEIKYSRTLRRQELKQILKYKRGLIAYRGTDCGVMEGLTVIPIPLLAYIAA